MDWSGVAVQLRQLRRDGGAQTTFGAFEALQSLFALVLLVCLSACHDIMITAWHPESLQEWEARHDALLSGTPDRYLT